MGRGTHANSFLHNQEEGNSESAHENAPDSPSHGDEARTAPARPSPKKRKGWQKRVMSVPIMGGDNEQHGDGGSNKIKGEGSSSSTSLAPCDSWAWRKYGQKPIKGSPYPRGYYRCSTSKGCPARKQVERSRLDPAMLLITYSSDHNHPLPSPKHLLHHHHHHQKLDVSKSEPEDSTSASAPASASEFVTTDIGEDSLINDPDFHWLAEAASAASYPLRPIYTGSDSAAVAESTFSMGEEDESLFGDLGELPEYSLVFRLGNPVESEETSQRCSMSAVPCVGPAA